MLLHGLEIRRFIGLAALVGLAALAGCGAVDPGMENEGGQLDSEVFNGVIQPILDERGCSESQCHYRDKLNPNSGGPGGSFRIYNCEESTCSDQELTANYESAAAMSNPASPSDSKLLTKPLAESSGGVQHLGGSIFLDNGDPDYLAILSWIQSPL